MRRMRPGMRTGAGRPLAGPPGVLALQDGGTLMKVGMGTRGHKVVQSVLFMYSQDS